MALIEIASIADRYPVGTTVEAYAVSEFPPGWSPGSDLPAGLVAAGSGDVADSGALTIGGLDDGGRYRLYASVGGQARYVTVTANAVSADRGFLNATDEGVPTDGSDAGPAITSFLARAVAAGAEARFPHDLTYTVLTGFTVPEGVRVRAHRDAVFDLSGAPINTNCGIAAGTEEATPRMLIADAVAEDFTVNVGPGFAAGLNEGDWVRLCSDTYFAGVFDTGSGVNQYIGERLRVVSADDVTGIVTFLNPIQDDYPIADDARLTKITPVEGIDWDGGHFIGGGLNARHTALRIDKAVDCRINTRADYCENVGVLVLDSSEVNVNMRGDGGGAYTGTASYGISFQYTCQDCTAAGFDIMRYKHAVSLGGGAPSRNGINRRIKYLNGTARATISTGLDAHSGCIDLLIDGCSVWDAGDALDDVGDVGGGISVRCPDATVTNNRVRRARAYGMWIRNQSADPTRWSIDNNRISHAGSFGMEVNIHTPIGTGEVIDGNSITGNIVVYSGDDGIKVFGRTGAGVHFSGLDISNNTSSRNTGYGIHMISVDNSTLDGNQFSHNTLGGGKLENCDENTVTSNNVLDDAATGVGIYLLTGCTSNLVEGNVIVGCDVGVQIDAGATGNYVGANVISSTTTPIVNNGGATNITARASGEPLNLGDTPVTPFDYEWLRAFDVESMPLFNVASSSGTLTSGTVYGVVVRARRTVTCSKLRVSFGTTTPSGVTGAKMAVHNIADLTNAIETVDFAASVAAGATVDAALGGAGSYQFVAGQLYVLSVVVTATTTMPVVRGIASVGSLNSAARQGAGVTFSATGWTAGSAVPTLTSTSTGPIPWLRGVP